MLLTQVMSQEFAIRNHILAVEVHTDRIVIGTDQPFRTDWLNNLEKSLAPKKLNVYFSTPSNYNVIYENIIKSAEQ